MTVVPKEPFRRRSSFMMTRHLRAAFFEHVLLTPCGENTWMAAHGLFDLVTRSLSVSTKILWSC